MAERFVSMRNVRFLLYEVFGVQSLCETKRFSGHTKKTFDMILDATFKLARDQFFPICGEMDEHPPYLENGVVKVHPNVSRIMRELGEGGWTSAAFPPEQGGDGLPFSVTIMNHFIFNAANYSAAIFPELASGAARLITSFGSKELNEIYVPNMLAGRWQGTMALTEPQAGSSLSDITTEAQPTEEGWYSISGHKIFISAGDHDGAENVVHLMLAKIPGGPKGVKGISMFVVPKLRPEAGGFVPNDVTVTQVFHKLGYRGAPLTELSIGEKGGCRGYLVGEPNNGLKYMFQLMNEARLGVGTGAAGIASAAYHEALEYVKKRTQGRNIASKDPALPQIPIIEHADVKRMLLFQRGVVEGGISLILECCMALDKAETETGEEKEKWEMLLEILTPIAKTYPSEMGILSCSQAIQCLGGYGFCEDFSVEQYYRDMRIHPIHEGTTGIQAMDLLGRKCVMNGGKAFMAFMGEAGKTVAEGLGVSALAPLAKKLGDALESLQNTVMILVGRAQAKGPDAFLADATLFLECFGHIAVSWQWLKQALAAAAALGKNPSGGEKDFYEGKILTCRYFFAYELPKTLGLFARLSDEDPITLQMQQKHFTF
ncbi:MAG: acyl-CoA dehydrogenase [Deltaproteobacteria bacterium]|nr:acyl-CoA dehydrogenase [Deltaproteobacteria bacterium]